jgi:hypothetical protein
MLKNYLIILLLFIACQVYSQGKKTIKNNKVNSITVTEIAADKPINDSKTVYDANGEVVEKIEYTKEGVWRRTVKYKLNYLGDVIEEFEYDEKNNLLTQTIIKYNAAGNKKEEFVYDPTKKLIEKHVYVYNAKGLKIERKTFDAEGKLLSTKKFVYTYRK